MNPHWVLVLRLVGDPDVSVADGARIDADAVAAGLDARLGDGAEGWNVSIESAPDGVRVRGRAAGRAPVDQNVELPPDASEEERSIIVASSLAFSLEQAQTVAGPAEPLDDDEAEHVAGDIAATIPPWWVSSTGHVSLGLGPPDPAGGLALEGGRWLGAGRHLRASASLGWAHGTAGALSVHALRPGVQLDAGRALCSRTWLGAGLGIGATGAWARDRDVASGWALRVQVPAIIDVVLFDPLFFRGALGFEFQTPSLRFIGASSAIRWRAVRPYAAVSLGVRLGKRRRLECARSARSNGRRCPVR